LLIFHLTSCRGTTKSSDAGNKYLEHVYTEQKLPLDTDEATYAFEVAGETVYYTMGGGIAAQPLAGGDATVAVKAAGDAIASFAVRADGNLAVAYRETVGDSVRISVVPNSAADVSVDFDAIGNGQSPELFIDSEGYLYAVCSQAIYVLDGESGELLFSQSEPTGLYGSAISRNGFFLYTVRVDQRFYVKNVDAATQEIREYEYKGDKYLHNLVKGGGNYDFYFIDGGELLGFSLGSDSAATVISFVASDIVPDSVYKAAPLADGDFAVMKFEPGGGFRTEGIFRLTYDPDAGKIPKTIITLGPADTTAYGVMEFNRSHSNVRIETKSYDKYITIFDNDGHNTHMDLDLLKGTAPDIMLVNAEQLEKYASKGVFADLTPFLDADTTIDRADLFGNILGLGTYDDRLCGIMTTFGTNTLSGKASIFGEEQGITMQELIAIADNYPKAEVIFGVESEYWVSMSSGLSISDYIDWENGTCDFDNEQFIATLNFARDRFPLERRWFATSEAAEEEFSKAVKSDTMLLSPVGLNGIRTAHDQNLQFGEPTTFVGWPSASGNGNTASGNFYAINEKCENKQLAWEFIRQFLYEDYDNGEYHNPYLSVSRAKFERELAAEQIPLRERDFSMGITIFTRNEYGSNTFKKCYSLAEVTEAFPQLDIDNYAITEDEAQQMRDLIEGITTVPAESRKVSSLIYEETQAFLEGAKSAEETARIVQSRVSLLVGEGK
jgi:ABC-type glycerol-3-phosphate transport system substrate-binding protein